MSVKTTCESDYWLTPKIYAVHTDHPLHHLPNSTNHVSVHSLMVLRAQNKELRELLKKCVPALEMWTDGAVGLTSEEYCLVYEVREVTK